MMYSSSSLPAANARFIVCEKEGRWAAAFRQLLADSMLRVRETRSLAESWDDLQAAPLSLVACELTPVNLEPVVDWLQRVRRYCPRACIVALATSGAEPLVELAREAGASYAATSLRNLGHVKRVVLQHFERVPSSEPSMRESIWFRLPWSECAEPHAPSI